MILSATADRVRRVVRDEIVGYTAMVSDSMADAIAVRVAARLCEPNLCQHLADSNEPGASLMSDACPNCGRYYVNDDNSVERPRGDLGGVA